MGHRVFKPFGLQFRHRQALEKFLPALVIAFERGDQKALAEPPRAAQGIHPSRLDQAVNQIRLVHIEETIFPDFLKRLYSKRVF